MADKIDVKTLGHSGVIIDQNPLEPTLPDDALQLAQNAMHDPTQGFGGALRKRPGLAKFNIAYAGGPILGGVLMAVAGTGGAPVSGGGGSTGDSTGSGNGTGAPGTTTDGSSNPAFSPAGAGSFGGGALFGGARLFLIGRDDNSDASLGTGWYVGSTKLANTPNSVTTPGPPQRVYSFPPTATFAATWGLPSCWHAASGYLYYVRYLASQVSGGQITIRKTNGGSDVLVGNITPAAGEGTTYGVNPPGDVTIRGAVTNMTVGFDGNIYMAVKYKASGQTTVGNGGAIFKLIPSTGAITEMNASSTPGLASSAYAGIPYSIAHFNGSVYWGEHNLGVASDTQKDTNANIYATTTDQSYSLVDHGFTDGEIVSVLYPFPQTAPASNPSLNVAGNCILFCGFGVNKAVPNLAWMYRRNRLPVQQSSAYLTALQASGGAAQSGNYWVSMVAFNDNLYASFYNPAAAANIFQLVPNYANVLSDGGWDGTGAWTTVFTAGSNFVPLYLFVDNGILYAIGSLALGLRKALWSADGTNWNDVTANMPTFANQSYSLPVFAGFNQ